MLTLISASLSVQNSSSITKQSSLFNTFLSTISLSDLIISNITIVETSVRVASSSLNISNMTISRISDPNNLDLMFISLDSILDVDMALAINIFKSKNIVCYN